MLRKLLKYDLRANMKIYCFLWPCIIIAAILHRYLIPTTLPEKISDIVYPLLQTVMMFAIFGSVIAAMVICVSRFYKGLLKEEGYLMFTLPVRPWQLILSKLLVSLLTILLTGIVSIVGAALLWGSFEDMIDFGAVLFSPDGFITGNGVVDGIYIVTLLILYQALAVLQIYLACAIGHLVKKHRVITAIAVWFGLSYGQRFLLILWAVFTIFAEQVTWWLLYGSVAGLVALFFFLTQLILKKRLNLE